MIRDIKAEVTLTIPQTGDTEYVMRLVSNAEMEAITAAGKSVARAYVSSGGHPEDAELARSLRENMNENLARSIVAIRNVREAGDEITDRAKIVDVLRDLTPAAWNVLTAIWAGDVELSAYEKKA